MKKLGCDGRCKGLFETVCMPPKPKKKGKKSCMALWWSLAVKAF